MNDVGHDDRYLTLIVETGQLDKSSLRLDQYVAQQVPDLSRSRVQRLIEEEFILVNDRPAKASTKLCGGEEISIELPEPVSIDAQPEDIAIEIVYQDEYLAVINKAAGMSTHPGAGVQTGTLVNALLFHMGESLSGIGGRIRPGVVHRLDKDTSGLIVVAKQDVAHQNLAEQIRCKTARRVYLALVEGNLKADQGTIDKPIGRHPTKRKQMGVVASGRKAVSHFQVMQRLHDYTLVKVSLETGRTHQIRVHMASLNHPVVGDLLYNPKFVAKPALRAKMGLKGQALHAHQLTFNHPLTGLLLKFEAPLPDDFQLLLSKLQ